MTGFHPSRWCAASQVKEGESLLHLAVRGSVPKRSKENPPGGGLSFGSAMTMDTRGALTRRLCPSLVLLGASSMDWARPIWGIQTAAALERAEVEVRTEGRGSRLRFEASAHLCGFHAGPSGRSDEDSGCRGDRTCSGRARTVWAPASWTTLRFWIRGTAPLLKGHGLRGCPFKQPHLFRAVPAFMRHRTRIPP